MRARHDCCSLPRAPKAAQPGPSRSGAALKSRPNTLRPSAARGGRRGLFTARARPGPAARPTPTATNAAASAEGRVRRPRRCPPLADALPLSRAPLTAAERLSWLGTMAASRPSRPAEAAGWGRGLGSPPPDPARGPRRCSPGPCRKPAAEAERGRAGCCLPPPLSGGAAQG